MERNNKNECGDVPERIARVRRKPDGQLDEIIAIKPDAVHLEQITRTQWWLGIEREGYRQSVHFLTKIAPITVTTAMDDWPGEGKPTAQELTRYRELSMRQRVGLSPTEYADMICIAMKIAFAKKPQISVTGDETPLLKDLRELASKHRLE